MTAAAWQRERHWLGYAGLLPFVAGLATMAWGRPEWQSVATETLRNYAAVIASFLGAVHWGVAVADNDRLARARLRWGITPALLAWTLLTLPDPAALLGFAVLFGLILWVDRYLLPILDTDYRQLRLRLSLVVVIVMVAAAALAENNNADATEKRSGLTDTTFQTQRYRT